MSGRFQFRVWDMSKLRYWDDVAKTQVSLTIDGLPLFWTGDEARFVGKFWPHDRWVLEQCTGLTDKNGKDIYEGDILSWCDGEAILAVQYIEEYARFGGLICLQHGEEVENDAYHYFDDHGMPNKCEVIGNVNENRELLMQK